MADNVHIDTDRLILRDWTDADAEPFAALNADPRVMEFFPKALSRAESDAFLARIRAGIAERGYGLYATEEKWSGKFIGYVGLAPVPFDAPFTPAIEIGWRLARTAWGSGYATEAARAVMAHAFGTLGFDVARLVHGRVEQAVSAGDGEDRHDPRPGRRFPAPGAPAGPQARAPCALSDRKITVGWAKRSVPTEHSQRGHGATAPLPTLRFNPRSCTATKRRSPSLLARRRSADLRPSFLRLSMRFCTSSGVDTGLLRYLDDDVAGLQPLLGGGAAGEQLR